MGNVSNLCPSGVGIWIGSMDYHKGSCSAIGCLWHMVSPKNFSDPIYYWPLSGSLPAVLQFKVSLKQEGSTSLATWHIQIPGKIITELSVRRCDHQETGGDLEGARVPPGWGGLTPMYSRQTSVSTQLGGRPTIVFSGNVSSTRQHSNRGTLLKKMGNAF